MEKIREDRRKAVEGKPSPFRRLLGFQLARVSDRSCSAIRCCLYYSLRSRLSAIRQPEIVVRPTSPASTVQRREAPRSTKGSLDVFQIYDATRDGVQHVAAYGATFSLCGLANPLSLLATTADQQCRALCFHSEPPRARAESEPCSTGLKTPPSPRSRLYSFTRRCDADHRHWGPLLHNLRHISGGRVWQHPLSQPAFSN